MTCGWSDKRDSFQTLSDHHGSVDKWSQAANQLFASGCEPQGFALLSSFAAPLMPLFVRAEGGCVVSITGGRGAGKSVAMTAAGTVWGHPDKLLLKRGNDRIPSVAELCHLPVLTATMAHIDPAVASAFIAEFLASDRLWSTVLLSFSNESIRYMSPAIVEFDLRVPRGLIQPDKSSPSILERRLLDNRGTAGFLYSTFITERVPWLKRLLTKHFAVVMDDTGAGFGDRFAVRAIAGAWVAGIVCVQLGILECSPERIARWAIERVLSKKEAAE